MSTTVQPTTASAPSPSTTISGTDEKSLTYRADVVREVDAMPGDTRITYLAASVYLTNKLHDQALKQDNPAKTLDDIADALPEIMPGIFKDMGTAPDLAAALLPLVVDRIWAHTVVEHAKAAADPGYRYVYGILADGLRKGGDPASVRADVQRVTERLAAEAAVAAVTEAVTAALAGLATNPHDVAERLHMAVEDVQAGHLARVAGMSLEKAEAAEAFSTATSAMARAMSRSVDPEGTAQGLRAAVRMVIDEARG